MMGMCRLITLMRLSMLCNQSGWVGVVWFLVRMGEGEKREERREKRMVFKETEIPTYSVHTETKQNIWEVTC